MAALILNRLQSRIPGMLTHPLAALTLAMQGAEITGLNGPSGSGKSLLLRAIADLDPSSGNVSLADLDRMSIPAHQWRKKVAYLPTDSSWWFDTVGEHFLQIDPAVLHRLGFDEAVMSWKVSRISSGEKQRLALARCLNRQPQVLLLDEPTASLGKAHTDDVERLVCEYIKNNDVPVLWVSHDPEQLERLSQRILNIQPDGSILEQTV